MKTITAYAKDMSRFLQKSELTERRAFIETFVKEIERHARQGCRPVYHPHFSIDTKSCSTRGRSIWMRPGKVRRIDRWACHLNPDSGFDPSQMGLRGW